MTIVHARQTMTDALQDSGLRRAYVDNISCVLMDRIPELCKVKSIRDEISEAVLTRIFED